MRHYQSIYYTRETNKSGATVFKIQLAGERKQDVEVIASNKLLTIKLKGEDLCYIDAESCWSKSELDMTKSKASMEHGLLTIEIPKKYSSDEIKIPVT